MMKRRIGRARFLALVSREDRASDWRWRAFGHVIGWPGVNRRTSVSAMGVPLVVVMIVALAVLSPLTQTSLGSSGTRGALENSTLTSGTGSWAVQDNEFATTGISCASSTACLASGNVNGGGAFSSMTGTVWSTPELISGVDSFSQISCPSSTICFAIGMSSASPSVPIVEEMTNSDGTWTWTQLNSPSTFSSVYTISCASVTLCVIGGNTPDGGGTRALVAQLSLSTGSPVWTVSSGWDINDYVTSISCTTTLVCGAMEELGVFYYSANGGSSWTESTGTLPNQSGSYYYGLSCQPNSGSSTTCVAVGQCYSFGCEGGALPQDVAVTTFSSSSGPDLSWAWDGGQSGALLAVACANSSQCMAVGWGYGSEVSTSESALSISTTGPSASTETLPPVDAASPSSILNAVACATGTECFIGGPFGIDETTNGTSFQPVAFEVPALADVSCGTATDCLAATDAGTLAATNDGGALWFNLPPLELGQSAGAVSCVGPSICYASIGSGDGALETYVTSNLGLTWTAAAGPPGPGSSDHSRLISCPTTTVCIGVSPYTAETETQFWTADVTTNSGESWTQVVPTSAPAWDPSGISCPSITTCLIIGGGSGVDAELLTEAGGVWTPTLETTGATYGLDGISCPTATTCMMVGPNGGSGPGTVISASISGSSVTFTSLSGDSNIPHQSLDAVACSSALSCSIFGSSTGAQTSNGGGSFSPIGITVLGASIVSATCGGSGSCFAVGIVQGQSNGRNVIGDALVLATDGQTSSAFLPTPLVPADSFGGPDGSRPCFSCALKAAGLSAQGFDGDPVNTADGDYSESVPIVSIPGLGPNLSFTATYDSQLAQTEVADSASPGPLGWGWSGSPFMNLQGAGGTGNVTVDEEGGAQITYIPASAGPGFGGSTCTSGSSLQCFVASESDVTAVLEETIGSPDTYQFSRNGGMTTDNFNTSGQLTSIKDSNNYSETFAYGVTTGTNCTTSGTACDTETDAEGRVLDIVYATSTGLVGKVIDPAGRTWTFAYDTHDNLISITNPRSGVESFGYDTTSLNTTMVHNMTTLTEPNGQTGGPDAGAHLAIAYEESATAANAPLGYVTSQTDPIGLFTEFSYAGDNMGATGTTTVTTCLTATDCADIPPVIQSESEDNYLGGVLMSRVTGVNTAHPETTSYVRNALGMPTSVTDGNGNATSYTYDPDGNILTSTDASENTTTYTYNAYNELLTATPPSGSSTPETINTYDSAGNLETSKQHPGSGSDLTTTDNICGMSTCSVGSNNYKEGEVESTVDPRGYTTTFTYDTYGDLASSTDPVGDDTTYAYTAIGQLFCSTSPNATHSSVSCPTSPSTRVADTTSETFDSSDTVLATSTDPSGNTTTYTFDADGNQTVVEDPDGNYNVIEYDADDRPNEVVDGLWTSAQTITTTAYDQAPGTTNCSTTTAPTVTSCTIVTQAQGTGSGALNAITSSYYDGFNNLIDTVDPGGEVTTDTYDQANNLATSMTAAGTTTYNYQPNNWLSSETFAASSGFTAPSSSTSFTYYNDGVRHTMVDATGTTTYDYDPYGRLQSVEDGASNTVTYGYDQDGDTTCISYPNSGTNNCQNSAAPTTGLIAYGYDNADRMTSVEDWNGKTTTFGYDYDTNWNGTTYPTTHATTVAETYGNDDNLTNETVDNSYLAGNSQSTTWAPNGDDLFASTQANSGTVESYGYNQINQVTSLAGSDAYTYDQLGRVTSDTPSGGSATNFGYTTDSALCWTGTGTGGSCASPPSGSTSYGANAINERCYANTNTTTGSCASPPNTTHDQTYAYNQLGEMTCSTVANTPKDTCNTSPLATKYSTTYTYNGDGLRMSDTPAATTPTTQQFTWDVSTSVPQLLADGTNSYIYGPNGTPIEQMVTSSSVANYLVSNPTGVIYQFKASGAKNGVYTYNPYGQCATGCGSINTPFGFEDGYTDASGLIYLVNRYYDPSTDQFTSVDPLVSETGQPFSYANDDPVNGSDPSGLISAGTICGEDGSSSAACKGAEKISISVVAAECKNDPQACANGPDSIEVGLEGGVNCIEGIGNSILTANEQIVSNLTLGHVNPSATLPPIFNVPGERLGLSYDVGSDYGTGLNAVDGEDAILGAAEAVKFFHLDSLET